jgi:hypothetical protein
MDDVLRPVDLDHRPVRYMATILPPEIQARAARLVCLAQAAGHKDPISARLEHAK